ncbi:MAG TPA: glycosyltransferase family 1 protein [Patescibacteria group bacterium]|nr:glycosyltransferase family 1 protein [Patescibacteria group bacterium]
MKIAIDSSPLTSGHKIRGVGFYTRNLIAALGDNVEAVDFSKANLSKYDVIHLPYFNPFFIDIPFVTKPKLVVTIHDTIPLIYPDIYKPGIKGRIRFFINKLILKRVSAVITLTETSKKDIVRLLGIPAKKVFPIFLAPAVRPKIVNNEKDRIRRKYNLPEKYAFYVGDINYVKNIPRMVEACKKAKIVLVMSGKQVKDIENQDLNHPELAHLKGINWSGVIRLGYAPDEDVPVIFSMASVFVHPALYEGFGITIIEAMSYGVPVVAGKAQALVEIGQGGCLFANPKSTNDISEKISEVLTNKTLRNQLIESGKVLAKSYSWEKTAKETLEVYRHV